MITRRKAALQRALPQGGTNPVGAASAKMKAEKFDGAETSGGEELVRKMQVISLSSDSENDDNSESDSSDEEEASTMSQTSDVSAVDQSEDDEVAASGDDGSEVVQLEKESVTVSDDYLIAEKVHQVIKEGGDLEKLTLHSCRSYLRHNGMRISGNKPVLIDRIKQHIELKQGVSKKYRAASFTINCTGDVCKGDVIKFKQKVHRTFNVVQRGADVLGERIVVGRVVKESYGEKKQQHTFTVEVLWSTGYKPLPPMRKLLVKGRNLYRLRTYRQKWEDEGLRKISLDEKHERGAAARSKRRETLKASGRRKTTVGGRKQLPNPSMSMGPNAKFAPDIPGGRGSEGPLHRRFPQFFSVPGQQIPFVPGRSSLPASREKAYHHINDPGGVSHHTRPQPREFQPKSASEADLWDRAEIEKKKGRDSRKQSSRSQSPAFVRFASTTSKEDASWRSVSTDGVPEDRAPPALRLQSKIVSRAHHGIERIPGERVNHCNSNARRDIFKGINNPSEGAPQSTRAQRARANFRNRHWALQ